MASAYHHPSLASLPDVEIAAVCDLLEDRAQAAAARFGIPRVYGDYRRMLAEVDPQAVYVLMPPQHLFEPVSACLDQGRHVFIEKPLGLTVWQARALAHRAERRGCRTMVGFQRRHVPALTALRRRVERRGPVWQVTVAFLKASRLDEPAWLYGGAIDALTSDGIHAVDLMRFLARGEPLRVAADVRRMYVPGGFPNAHTAVVTFSGGALGVLQFYYTTGRRIFRVEMHGRNATAYVDPDREALFVADDGEPDVRPAKAYADAPAAWGPPEGGGPGSGDGGAVQAPPASAALQPYHWLGFWHEHRHFVDCVRAGAEPSSNFADATRSMELVDTILHAAL